MNIVRLLGLLALAIFGGEMAIKFALSQTPIENEILKNVIDASGLVIIVFPFLYFFVFKTNLAAQHRLEHLVDQRTADIQKVNLALEQSLAELNARQREMALLSEMANFFQACRDIREATLVAETQLPRLFQGHCGVLFLANSSRNILEKSVAWGASADLIQCHEFKDCWAVRRNKAHLAHARDNVITCEHLRSTEAPWHLCLPLAAHGEVIGVLRLMPAAGSHSIGGRSHEISGAQMEFYTAVAETLALAMANLRLQESLCNQALRDPLTGLLNRRILLDSLDREIDRAVSRNQQLSIAMIDIDHFKPLNDTFGHAAGDAALSQIGQVMREMATGESEYVTGRYGGEEFILILPNTSADQAFALVDSLRQTIEGLSINHDGQQLSHITISAGIATCPQHGVNSEGLIRIADMALYRSKKDGRNRVTIASVTAGLTDILGDLPSTTDNLDTTGKIA